MLYGIAAGLIFVALIPAYRNLKKRQPDVKWDSILLGSFLLLFFIAMIGSAISLD